MGVTGPPAMGEWEWDEALERLWVWGWELRLPMLTSQQVTPLTATLGLVLADRMIKP